MEHERFPSSNQWPRGSIYSLYCCWSLQQVCIDFLPLQQSGLNNHRNISFNKWSTFNMWSDCVTPSTACWWIPLHHHMLHFASVLSPLTNHFHRENLSLAVFTASPPPCIRHLLPAELCYHSTGNLFFGCAVQTIIARHRHRWNSYNRQSVLESSSCHGNHLYPAHPLSLLFAILAGSLLIDRCRCIEGKDTSRND